MKRLLFAVSYVAGIGTIGTIPSCILVSLDYTVNV